MWDGYNFNTYKNSKLFSMVVITSKQNGDNKFSIGGYEVNPEIEDIDIAIDEIRLYNRALSEEEIAELYKMGGDTDTKLDLKVSNFNYTVEKSDEKAGTAYIHITSNIENEDRSLFYDNGVEKELESGTPENGYITLIEGQHKIKVCATDGVSEVCSDEKTIIVAKEIEETKYSSIPIEGASTGITNDGKDIIYGTISGKLYRLNISTRESSFIYDVDKKVSGLYYINSNNYYYSSIRRSEIRKLNISANEDKKIASVKFPDGLDVFNNKIYTVTEDRSGVLSIWNLDGSKIGTLNTSISDIVGISHTNKYLYILSEDGEIYQTNPNTGSSQKVFNNDELFSRGNTNNGLEAITILNNKIYVSYIDDESIYLIDIDLNQYE